MAQASWRDHISQYIIRNFSGKRVMMNDFLAPIHKIPTHSVIISVAIMAGLQTARHKRKHQANANIH
jgi:hypothetical protein